MCRGHRGVFVLIPCFCLAGLLGSGCQQWSQRGAKGVGLLSKAPAGEKNFSSYQPQNPYTQLVPGVLTRTLYEASSGKGYRIEVRDLLVGPLQRAQGVSLPGAALAEILSGNGTLTLGERRQDLTMGSTVSIPEGAAFAVENKSDAPIAMRVRVFKAE